MTGVQETVFQQYFPRFTDEDAAKSLCVHGEIVSMMGRKGVPDLFVVQFASRTGRHGPFVLNRLTAATLRQILQQEGF